MGYQTDLYGDIDISSATPAQVKAIKKRLKEMLPDEHEEIEVYDDNIAIHCYWKNYWDLRVTYPGFEGEDTTDNTLLHVLRRIAIFFPDDADGHIAASGEESEDLWELKITGKNIKVLTGKITYEEIGSFNPSEEAMLSVESLMVQLQGGKDNDRRRK